LTGAPTGVTATASIAITGNSGTLTINTTAGVAAGTYPLTVTLDGATSGIFNLVVQTTPPPPVASITVTGAGGATTITSNGGTLQMSASVQPTNAVQTVTWSVTNGTGRATINSSGLLTAVSNGTVTVRATATDGSGVSGTHVITISGQVHTLTVINGSGSGVYAAGSSVRITANNASIGMEFDRWTIDGGTIDNPIGSTTFFTMPAHNVTVRANYKEMGNKTAWDAASALIEGRTFTIDQRDAGTSSEARVPLAERINELIRPTGFFITHHDIVVFYFNPAISGSSERSLNGVNGAIGFRVTPPNLLSAYASGIITATPFDPTSNAAVTPSALKAWNNNGVLHVSGLTEGEQWQVYNLSGVLIHQAEAAAAEAKIILSERGVYIVKSGSQTIIAVY
jgi:hypothetical protein